jgi:hypothetical protein
VLTASVALIITAVSSSETSVYFYQTTWRNIPEDSHLQKWKDLATQIAKDMLCLVSKNSYADTVVCCHRIAKLLFLYIPELEGALDEPNIRQVSGTA